MGFLRKLLAVCVAGLLFASQAEAMSATTRYVVLNGAQPGWVHTLYGPAASHVTAAADFANNRYWVKGVGSLTVTDIQSTTYAAPTSPVPDSNGVYQSIAANTLPRANGTGAQWYGSRTNLFLNSQAPVTQTVTVVSSSVYTVSVIGNASVVLSGAGTGTVTQGSPKTITAGSTSLVCTVSGAGGSFQNVQVELGAFHTPPIITAGTAVTVAAPITTLKGAFLAAALAAKGAAFVTNGVAQTTGGPSLIRFSGGAFAYYPSASGVLLTDGTNSAQATFGSGTTAGIVKSALGMGATSFGIIANGGTKASSANPWANNTGTLSLGNRSAGDKPLNGNMTSFAFIDTDATQFANLSAAP